MGHCLGLNNVFDVFCELTHTSAQNAPRIVHIISNSLLLTRKTGSTGRAASWVSAIRTKGGHHAREVLRLRHNRRRCRGRNQNQLDYPRIARRIWKKRSKQALAIPIAWQPFPNEKQPSQAGLTYYYSAHTMMRPSIKTAASQVRHQRPSAARPAYQHQKPRVGPSKHPG
jgi:hypothetical protein